MEKQEFTSAISAIQSAQKIVLASHVNPDGDAVGSILALTHALKSAGKDVTPILVDGVPDIYHWMPGSEWIQKTTDRTDFDLAIVCDSGALYRIGSSLQPLIESIPILMDIDHHIADGTFGDIQIIDSTAASTTEILFPLLKNLIEQNFLTEITPEIAECLMVGLITDTGSFKYNNVTPNVFHLAGELQKLGAKPAKICDLVYENRSFASTKLLGIALDSIQTTADGRIAWAKVTAQNFRDWNATDADTEAIVSHVRALRGVEIGILFREIPNGKVRIISTRTSTPISISKSPKGWAVLT